MGDLNHFTNSRSGHITIYNDDYDSVTGPDRCIATGFAQEKIEITIIC